MKAGSAAATASPRVVHPLGLHFRGAKWTLVAWCELRDDYRMFRLDRIRLAEITVEEFREETGRNLEDYLKRYAGGR